MSYTGKCKPSKHGEFIALDFDDTLFPYLSKTFPKIYKPFGIHLKVHEVAKSRQRQGAKLILWTCRVGKALEMAVKAANKYEIYFDAINENPWTDNVVGWEGARKPYATIYVDDRSPGSIEYFVHQYTIDMTT